MGKLMLLGGSNCQLAAAQAAKAMGHTLVLADYLNAPPAKSYCDIHAQVSTFDIQGCIRAAKEHHVDGVFTVGTDQPVYTAACVAEALSLPSPISVDTALKATNKRAMKQAFQRYGIPHVAFDYLKAGQSAEHLQGLQTPLVIKPLDSQGQRGVFKVATPAEALARLPDVLRFSREDTALVETFYPSEEVTFSAYLWEGRLYPLLLTDRQLMRDPVHIGVCAAHRFPSVHAHHEPEIIRICEGVAQALGATQGALYVQLLIGKQGILVNEAACRIGGAFEDAMIPYATGFDILQTVISTALGGPWNSAALRNPRAKTAGLQMSVQMLFCKPGTLASITPLARVQALPGVITAGYHYHIGETMPAMENATMRFGHCLLATQTGDMTARVKALYALLHVTDTDGNSLIIPRTYDGEDEPDVQQN